MPIQGRIDGRSMNEVTGQGRPLTGPMHVNGEQWPGVFIRGDEALSYARDLRMMADAGFIDPKYVEPGSRLGGLISLLESCRQ